MTIVAAVNFVRRHPDTEVSNFANAEMKDMPLSPLRGGEDAKEGSSGGASGGKAMTGGGKDESKGEAGKKDS